MRTLRSIVRRTIGCLAAIAVGLVVQTAGILLGALTGLSIILDPLAVILGFAVMGCYIYKWVIK